MNDWKTWVTGALFAILMAIFGFSINAQNQRMASSESFAIVNRERIVAIEQKLAAQKEQLDKIERGVVENNRLLIQHMGLK